jgi:amino acid adenylation domain-containing protein
VTTPCPDIATLVGEVAARRPHAPALIGGGVRLSFAELDRRADALAVRLTAAGVGTETPVAVHLPRSVDHVVATLAIWKAHGVCVPIDPALPRLRADTLRAVAGCGIEITGGLDIRTVPGAPEPAATRAALGSDPPADDGDRLAYIFFTSGSTGRPKGVAVPHAGIVNEARWTAEAFRLGPQDRGSWLAAPGFAISRWELWSSLVAGVAVAVAEPALEWDPAAVRQWLVDSGVTWTILVTGLGEQLLRRPWPAGTGLRLLVVGGEQLRVWPPETPFEVVNSYGVTEASSVRLVAWLSGPARRRDGVPPIGRPIANTEVYVLDENRRPVPPGEVGELCLGGTGLARGYVGDPERTAAAFPPDPFRPDGARMYRTGDLVRADPDGTVHYVRRAGADVKIDGVRVDVGEIESVLLAHPAVAAAAVAVREAPGGSRLVAYLTARPGDELSARDLRGFLAERLPRALVPTTLVRLAELPLLPSGKVDRPRLPEPGAGDVLTERFVAPWDDAERAVADAFAAVVGCDRVGAYDDFFALGGDSLGLARVSADLAEHGWTPPPTAALFESRTPASIAELLRRSPAGGAGPVGADPVATSDSRRALPMPAMSRGIWLADRLRPQSTAYVEVITVDLDGALDVAALRRSLRRLVRRQPNLRTSFPDGESGPVRRVWADVTVSMSVTDLPGRRLSAPEVLRVLGECGELGVFDVEKGPLVRLRLLRSSPAASVLALVVHHLVWDGGSAGVLLAELADGYDRDDDDGEVPVPEVPADAGSGDYWARSLAGAPAQVWPGTAPVPDTAPARSAELTHRVPAATTQRIRERLAPLGLTPYMVGLGCLALALRPWRDADDLVVSSAMSVRPPAAGATIGFYVNTVPVRIPVAGSATVQQFWETVRTRCVEAWTHRLTPFEDIVAAAMPARSADGVPFTRVMFSHNRMPGPVTTAGGLRMRLRWLPGREPKADLEVAFDEYDDGLDLRVHYDRARLTGDTAARIAEAVRSAADRLTADPGRRLDSLPEFGGPRPAAREPVAPPSGPGATDPVGAGDTDGPAAQITGLWCEVLGMERADDGDDFFDRGGRSIDAARLVTRINRVLGVNVPLRLLFVTDSLAEFRGRILHDHLGKG